METSKTSDLRKPDKMFLSDKFFSQELDVYVSHKAAYFVQCKTGVCSPRWPWAEDDFCLGAGDQTQEFKLVRQALYQLSIIPGPLRQLWGQAGTSAVIHTWKQEDSFVISLLSLHFFVGSRNLI